MSPIDTLHVYVRYYRRCFYGVLVMLRSMSFNNKIGVISKFNYITTRGEIAILGFVVCFYFQCERRCRANAMAREREMITIMTSPI